jgi:hypothetical protein
LDKFDFSRDGIKHVNIIDFLLGSLNEAWVNVTIIAPYFEEHS